MQKTIDLTYKTLLAFYKDAWVLWAAIGIGVAASILLWVPTGSATDWGAFSVGAALLLAAVVRAVYLAFALHRGADPQQIGSPASPQLKLLADCFWWVWAVQLLVLAVGRFFV